MDNNGRRIDAEFNGNSTRHHSNTLYYPAQGHWQCPHNPQHHLLSFFRSFMIVCTKVAQNPQPEENKDLTSLFDNMKASFVTL